MEEPGFHHIRWIYILNSLEEKTLAQRAFVVH